MRGIRRVASLFAETTRSSSMVRNREIVRRITLMVMNKKISPRDAADLLEANVRTVYNYAKRYELHGASGIIDHRHGNYRKLTVEMERRVVECKLQNAQRSACWIRNWLKLDVSVECVRKILVKHAVLRSMSADTLLQARACESTDPERQRMTWSH